LLQHFTDHKLTSKISQSNPLFHIKWVATGVINHKQINKLEKSVTCFQKINNLSGDTVTAGILVMSYVRQWHFFKPSDIVKHENYQSSLIILKENHYRSIQDL
jgi:hypothetical protein